MDKLQKMRRKNLQLFNEWMQENPSIQKNYANEINKRIRKLNKHERNQAGI